MTFVSKVAMSFTSAHTMVSPVTLHISSQISTCATLYMQLTPTYIDHTSPHHPLVGVGIILFGFAEVSLPPDLDALFPRRSGRILDHGLVSSALERYAEAIPSLEAFVRIWI